MPLLPAAAAAAVTAAIAAAAAAAVVAVVVAFVLVGVVAVVAVIVAVDVLPVKVVTPSPWRDRRRQRIPPAYAELTEHGGQNATASWLADSSGR